MIQFYAPEIVETEILPEGESLHCSRVLRMREGDEIVVTDGRGSRYLCEIIKSHSSKTQVKIKQKEFFQPERPYKLILAVAPTKNSERMEWMIEKAVEIGVDKIVLLKCERSERKVQKIERLEKIIISAMKQSLSVYKPELTEMLDFRKFIKENIPEIQKFFGYCSENYPKKSFVKECRKDTDTIVMIGPEGDFTEEEVKLAVENGYIPVTFGEKRLRTETAGVFAVTAVNVINQLSKD